MIAYIIGYISSLLFLFLIVYLDWRKNKQKVTKGEIILYFVISLFSWFSFFLFGISYLMKIFNNKNSI